jgi:receptor protein-tyrosine kinase
MNMKVPQGAFAGMGTPAAVSDTISIGEILVQAGILDAKAAARIAQAQREYGLRFGEAAVRLKLLSLADIEFALARQFEYPYLDPTDSSVAPDVMSAIRPFGLFAERMRSLRTRLLMLRAGQPSLPPSIAILSAMPREGRSVVAANLAVACSQIGERTLLIDADMRNPHQHVLFNLPTRMGLSNMLLGRAGPECIARVPQFFDLSVLTAGSMPPNPQELLARSGLTSLLSQAASVFDIVIVDTPVASEFADALIVASRTGSGIVVTRSAKTDAKVLHRVCASLRDCGANLVGTVLNDG